MSRKWKRLRGTGAVFGKPIHGRKHNTTNFQNSNLTTIAKGKYTLDISADFM